MPNDRSNSRPVKLDDPNCYASGYTLDLHCDHHNPADHEFREFPQQFFSEWKSEAFKDARRRGWLIRIDGTATCPKCCKALGLGKFRKRGAR